MNSSKTPSSRRVGRYNSASAKRDGGEKHHYADWKDHRRRMEIFVFPILLNPLGQSRRPAPLVAMPANAANAIAKGLSARSVAEGTHWVGEVGDHMPTRSFPRWTLRRLVVIARACQRSRERRAATFARRRALNSRPSATLRAWCADCLEDAGA
jgi:hypothetical protein